MSKLTIMLNTEDVAMLRAILHLAIVQSAEGLDSAMLWPDEAPLAQSAPGHEALCRLATRIDDMLPES